MNKFFVAIAFSCSLFNAYNINAEEKGATHLIANEHEQTRFIDQAISAFMRQHDIPGVAVAVFDGHNERIHTYGVADRTSGTPVSGNTIFEIASVTKVFTTTSLALQVLQGNMGLNDPVSKYIPALANQLTGVGKVTLLHLATHTSSLPRVGGNWQTGGPNKIYRFLQHWQPPYTVGTRYEYSNVAFGLLGYALEAVENRPYGEVIRNDILGPLGMGMTFTEVPESYLPQYAQGYNAEGKKATRRPHGYIPGSGAIRSTARDLLKFLKANMGVTGPEKLLKAMQFAQQPYFKVRDGFVMGLGWQRFDINGNLIIDKNGGVAGFTSYIGWIPEKQVGVVILTNKGKARTTSVGRKILQALAGQSIKDHE